MSDSHGLPQEADLAPGDEEVVSVKLRLLGYLVDLGLAILLTATSFFVAGTDLVWQPLDPRRHRRAGDRADGRASGVLPSTSPPVPITRTT